MVKVSKGNGKSFQRSLHGTHVGLSQGMAQKVWVVWNGVGFGVSFA